MRVYMPGRRTLSVLPRRLSKKNCRWCNSRYTHQDTICYTVHAGMQRVFLVVLALVWVWVRVGAGAGCPRECSCSGGMVDCSNRALTPATLPAAFPAHTTELRLHNNQLGALPSGVLDALKAQARVTLHGNPWACDCGVLYLRGWLLKHASDALIRNVSCSSPPGLRGRLVVYLGEEELLASCQYWMCDLALASQISLLVFIVVQGLLLAALVHFLRRFDRLTSDARRAAAEQLEPGTNEYVLLKDRSS